MKILLVSGHTDGYNPCASTKVNEGRLNIELVKECKALLPMDAVEIYPYDADMYMDTLTNEHKMDLLSCDLIVEVHHNAFNGNAHGCEAFCSTDRSDLLGLAMNMLDNIQRLGYANRGIKDGSNFANLKYCRRHNIPYILIEACFYDSIKDMGHYNTHAMANCIVDPLKEEYALSMPVNPSRPLYRVQVGAYSNYKNAEGMASRLKAAGFDSYIMY